MLNTTNATGLAAAGPQGNVEVEKRVLAEMRDICDRFPIHR